MNKHHSPIWQSVLSQVHLQQKDGFVLSVMGLAKNTGKTVALNHLLAYASEADMRVGLTSIGRDGEERDAVFDVPKPPVVVSAGMLVMTATDTLCRAKCRYQVVNGYGIKEGKTGINSPMGELILLQTLESGTMEVAGASTTAQQLQAINILKKCGAQLIFLDGALGRSQHASPAVADGLLLSTGAALGGSVADITQKTRERLALLTIPAFSADGIGYNNYVNVNSALLKAFDNSHQVLILDHDGQAIFHSPINTLNAGAVLMDWAKANPMMAKTMRVLMVSGAVGKQLMLAVETMVESLLIRALAWVVADGTRLFIGSADITRLKNSGINIFSHRAINIVGLSTNPTAPKGQVLGGNVSAESLLEHIGKAFPTLPTEDFCLNTQ